MIISVHMPKTAGCSFGVRLREHFGERMLCDYSDFPINTPPAIRTQKALQDAIVNETRDFASYDCIHGHFLPAKYRPLRRRGANFVVWLRDPLSRMVSHYNHWKRTYEATSAPALHRKVVEDNWSLDRFCFAEELRNFYAQFLWSFPLSQFDFVGITEHFDEDLAFFSRHYLGSDFPVAPRENVAPHNHAGQRLPARLAQKFTDFHAEDYRIYRSALQARKLRLVVPA